MRYILIYVISMALILSLNGMAAKVAPPPWTFDDDKASNDELKDWVDLNHLKPLEFDEVKDASGKERSVLKTTSLGGDPYMFPGGGWKTL